MTGNPITDFKVPLNNADSSLASAITDADVTLTVATGEGVNFPATADGDFWVSIDAEILLCTSRNIDILTVTRAAQGTAAAAHDAGAAVELRITQEAIEDIHSNIVTGILQGWAADDDQNPSIGTLPANAFVWAVDIWVEEAFNAGGADDSITVGWDVDSDAYVATGLNMTTLNLREHVTEGHGNAGDTLGNVEATTRDIEVYITHTGGEPTTGKVYVVVHYIVADAEPA